MELKSDTWCQTRVSGLLLCCIWCVVCFSFSFKSATKANPDAMRIIKRRAPPCLNVFCRLGCLCASLLHQRRHHHCGKPECMLGCSCLRRKVIALKSPKEEDSITEEPEPQGLSEDNKTKWKRNKKRKTYGKSQQARQIVYILQCTAGHFG